MTASQFAARGAAAMTARTTTVITQNLIYAAIIATLQAGLSARAVANVDVRNWYQRRVQGAPPGMALLLSNVNAHRYGFLGRDDRWDADAGSEMHTEIQAMEMAIQCTAQSPAPPPNHPLPPYAASDLARFGATILASDAGRAQLRAYGFGIERITDIRQPYFKDEADQFEQVPSFDFVLTFNQVERTTTPVVTKETLRIGRV